MSSDLSYCDLKNSISEISHHYGDSVHILSNTYLQTLLAKFSKAETEAPFLNHHVAVLYRHLLECAINTCFAKGSGQWPTRMSEFTDKGVFRGEIIDGECRAVVVNLARAGTFPSHLCYEELNYLLHPSHVRQDHFYLNRKTDEDDVVVGVDVSGVKHGGSLENSYVLLPDPMGATGGSLSYCIDFYKNKIEGTARKYIALHLIITPEYIKRMKREHPDVEIFSIRLDRGLSSPDILKTIPGTHIDEERGLTDHQYIVPGAGGVGEILNNSFC